MNGNYIVLNGKRFDLTNEQLDKIKNIGIDVKNKRWRANEDYYWFVGNDGTPYTHFDNGYDFNDYHFNSHNYFKSKEDAEIYARVLKTESMLREYADKYNESDMTWRDSQWYIVYEYDSNTIDINYSIFSILPRVVYFSDKCIAQKAIEKIGRERITEYLTYPW